MCRMIFSIFTHTTALILLAAAPRRRRAFVPAGRA
jgi:hypothetical protein